MQDQEQLYLSVERYIPSLKDSMMGAISYCEGSLAKEVLI